MSKHSLSLQTPKPDGGTRYMCQPWDALSGGRHGVPGGSLGGHYPKLAGSPGSDFWADAYGLARQRDRVGGQA